MMKSSGRTNTGGRKRPAHLIRAVIGFIGWMLSPLTPWNDAFVNVPLAIAIAGILEIFFKVNFEVGYWVGYTLTNLMGLFLLVIAFRGEVKEKLSLKSLIQSFAIALIVYVIITLLTTRITW